MSAFQTRPTTSPARSYETAVTEHLHRRAHDGLSPRAALGLAYRIIADLAAEGCNYADFQAAQSAQKAVRAAVRALAYHV